MSVVHINQCDSTPWCESNDPWANGDVVAGSSGPEDPREGDCHACLDAIMAYGSKAMDRKLVLVERRIAETRRGNL